MKNKMNPVIHFEMPYTDAQRVSGFYSQAFGWQMQNTGEQMGNYILAGTTQVKDDRPVTPGAINGGFFPSSIGVGTSVVISVDNLEDMLGKVKTAGGQIVGEVMDIPGVGRYVAFVDTEGNRVGMLQPMVQSG